MHVAVTPLPPFAVAVIVAVPAATPVTTPELDTVAIDVLLELHVTLAHAGTVVAVICFVSHTVVRDMRVLSKVREATSAHSHI